MITKAIIGLALSVVLAMGGRLMWVEWQYDRTKSQLTQAQDQLALAEKTVEQERTARVAAEEAAAAEAARREATFQDERAIRNEPITTECSSSPAIQRALGILRDRERDRRAAAADPD